MNDCKIENRTEYYVLLFLLILIRTAIFLTNQISLEGYTIFRHMTHCVSFRPVRNRLYCISI